MTSRRAIRRTRLATTTARGALVAAASLFSAGAFAQSMVDSPPPSAKAVDEHGVNLSMANYTGTFVEASIGEPAQGGLSYRQNAASQGFGLGYRDNVINITEINPAATGQDTVVVDGRSELFTTTSTGFTPNEKTGSTLTKSGTLYTYTTAAGDIYTLDSAVIVQTSQGYIYPYLTSHVAPDGTRTTYTYQRFVTSGTGINGRFARATSVSTSTGFGMTFTYDAATATNLNLDA